MKEGVEVIIKALFIKILSITPPFTDIKSGSPTNNAFNSTLHCLILNIDNTFDEEIK